MAISSRGSQCRSIVVEYHQYGKHSTMTSQYDRTMDRRVDRVWKVFTGGDWVLPTTSEAGAASSMACAGPFDRQFGSKLSPNASIA